MPKTPKEFLYTKEHEWIKKENSKVRLGITDFAQEKLTDVVFVELEKEGKEIKKGEKIAVLESVKSVSEVYSPVSGKIVQVNKELESFPELINKSPYENGWIAVIELNNPKELKELMSAKEYEYFTRG